MARNKKMKKMQKLEEEEFGVPAILPEDLVVEILTRLPAKSLLRFKSVCKHWKSITTEPTFISSHHKRSHTRTDGGSIVISVHIPKNDSELSELSVFSTTYEEGGLACHPLLLNRPELNGYIASSAATHGLILLCPASWFTANQPAFVFNPATRELVSLPPLGKNNSDMEEVLEKISKENAGEDIDFYVNYSLGFYPSTGMYKVLSMCTVVKYVPDDRFPMDTDTIIVCNLFYIFTLGTKEWRKLDIPKLPAGELVCPSCCVNGAIYFVANYRHNTHYFIAALDVGKEKFRLVPLPRAPPMNRLLELGGRLVLREGEDALWILEDHIEEKWIRVKLLDAKLLEQIDGRPYEIVSELQSSDKFLLAPLSHEVAKPVWVYYCDKNTGKEQSKFQITRLPDINNDSTHILGTTNNIETLFSPSTGLLQ